MPDLRRTALVAALLAPLALAGCGGDEKVGPKPDLPTTPVARWNPCDVLDAAFVKAQFGIEATEHAGTPTKPECRFTPAEGSGEAVVSANYLLFPGTLDQAWKTMGQQVDADVRTPTVDQADDARVVVNATKDQLYVTGFVQNGDLIQKVDVVDPAPYDEKRVVRGVVATLTTLSSHAAQTGAGSDPS
ncbi:hypothetical protein [Nocardioides daeguensis]|uniref:DUF3558 domain-containing protein n=1 Tax=Nocardioides daeguensis TaxID=908359 RepID=A0ABP6VGF8_9ACTN|nr:hypothetical protein [Nocardioides daeguensis]MBV6728861.1 hypothetical protein [Nocardioides daeguensis]MCR1773382.1 hypothetical protein [Nocardioides daeguensis]